MRRCISAAPVVTAVVLVPIVLPVLAAPAWSEQGPSFDTALPAVRIAQGDQVDVGSLVPTASGSKYEAGFGRSIWMKGAEAIYRTADPDGEELSCVRVGD